MMRNILLSAALALMTTLSSLAQSMPFTITGNAPATVKKVLVLDCLDSNASIASGEVKDGRFRINGKAQADALLGLQMEGAEDILYFFNDGQAVVADLTARTLIGSSQNSKLSAATMKLSELMSSVNAARQQFEAAKLSGMSRMGLQLLADSLNGALEVTERTIRQVMLKTIIENRNNLVPAVFAPSFVQNLPYESLFQVIDTTARYYRHPAAAGLREYVSQKEQQNKIVGSKFIDLEMNDVNGKPHRLSEYCGKGKYVLIDFWASWCGPCRMEMPNVVSAYNKYNAKGFEVVGLSFDSNAKSWKGAIENIGMRWVNLSDLKGWQSVAARVYGIRSIPSNLLVDPQGRIIAKDLRGQDLQNALAKIFGK